MLNSTRHHEMSFKFFSFLSHVTYWGNCYFIHFNIEFNNTVINTVLPLHFTCSSCIGYHSVHVVIVFSNGVAERESGESLPLHFSGCWKCL